MADPSSPLPSAERTTSAERAAPLEGVTSDGTPMVLPLAEETLSVAKAVRTTGRVRVRTVVDTAEQVVSADLATEGVEVTHVPVDREVDAVPAVRTEGDVTIVPVVEEIVVVEKRLVLREELHIRRVRSTEHVEVPVELRRERAVVERVGAEEGGEPTPG